MMILKNVKNIESLLTAISKCKGDVYLRSVDGSEEFNLKSTLSQYIGIARLCEDHGDEYEIFCANIGDEGYLFEFFYELKSSEQ